MYQKNDNVRERERVLKNLIWFCLIYCTSSWTQIWIIVDSSKGEGLKSQVCNCSQLKIQICWFSKRTEHYIIDKSSRPKTTAASGVSSCLAPLLKGQCTLSLFFCYFLPNSLLQSTLPVEFNFDGFNPSDLLLLWHYNSEFSCSLPDTKRYLFNW